MQSTEGDWESSQTQPTTSLAHPQARINTPSISHSLPLLSHSLYFLMYLSASVEIISGVLSKVVKMSLGVVCNHFYISCIDVSPHFNKWCISITDGPNPPERLFFWTKLKSFHSPTRHGTNSSLKLLLNIVFICSVCQMGGIDLPHPDSLAHISW